MCHGVLRVSLCKNAASIPWTECGRFSAVTLVTGRGYDRAPGPQQGLWARPEVLRGSCGSLARAFAETGVGDGLRHDHHCMPVLLEEVAGRSSQRPAGLRAAPGPPDDYAQSPILVGALEELRRRIPRDELRSMPHTGLPKSLRPQSVERLLEAHLCAPERTIGDGRKELRHRGHRVHRDDLSSRRAGDLSGSLDGAARAERPIDPTTIAVISARSSVIRAGGQAGLDSSHSVRCRARP